MTRKPYILKEEEIEILLNGIIEFGIDETYERMKYRALAGMKQSADVDEILMDQADTVLKRARNLSTDDESGAELLKSLYQLSAMLRMLAHEIYREYLKTDQERDNKRFLRLVK